MLENFGLYKAMKSDRIKDLLIRHFRDAIGFHTRHETKVLLCTQQENRPNLLQSSTKWLRGN